MCEYCRKILDEEYDDEWNPFIKETINVKIGDYEAPFIEFEVMISGDRDLPHLWYDIDNPSSVDDPIISNVVPIKYCPFCGEKLAKIES